MLLPDPHCLKLDRCVAEKNAVTMVVTTRRASAPCPRCDQPSPRVHSRYWRSLADLPWQGVRVRLHLQSRKFFCSNGECPQTIFTERLPTVVQPYARRTLRLDQALRQLGWALGGEAGARVARGLAMAASPDQLLRCLRRTPQRPCVAPRVLGIDEWAWRKGQRYGTILVDLERHCPVDLLPDRQAESVAAWLQAHPGVQVLCRDRANAYADAARRASPEALQVADRWHLLKNLREAVERVLNRQHRFLRQAAEAVSAETQQLSADQPETAVTDDPSLLTKTSVERQLRRQRRQARYQEVVALYRQGATIRAIASRFGMHRRTVRQYIRADRFPERAQPKARASLLDPFRPYLKQRWEQGCHTASQLWRELREQGFPGCQSLVRKQLAQLRADLPAPLRRSRGRLPQQGPTPRPGPSPRQASWWLLESEQTLKADQQTFLDQLVTLCPAAKTARGLAQQFQHMVRHRQADQFESWLSAASDSHLPELESFAAGLRRDLRAVQAALSLKWSNGQVEGQIHRLKLVKRQAYGRAKFDLLRARFLQAA
jgi:transposase